jgi:uncharacterized membrane protein
VILVTQTTWVRRPLEVAFGLLVAFIVLAAVVLFARWFFTDVTPFDGRLVETGLSAFVVVLWVVLGLGIAAVVMWAIFTVVAPTLMQQFGKGPTDWATFGAVSELKKRYAHGDITRQDYLEKLEDLERQQTAPAPVQK